MHIYNILEEITIIIIRKRWLILKRERERKKKLFEKLVKKENLET